MSGKRIGISLVAVFLSCSVVVTAQVIRRGQAADTPESAALRGMGAFLRGAGSYNLNTAKAESINTDTVIRWKQDLRKIAAEHRAEKERQQAGKKQHAEEVKRRVALHEYELRVNPTANDVQNGQALNALLYDLMDPDISSGDWYAKTVELPMGTSVKNLIFRFIPASGSSSASRVLSRGVIALSRLDIKGESWPTVMKPSEIDKERRGYEAAYAKLRDGLLANNFDVKTLLALDQSLDSLKAKVQTAVPKERGFRDEAVKFVEELKDATRMFDAVTVDYAKEILVDTKDQEAKTVAELVSFMLKYRLQFASAERSATGRVLYGQIYEAMRRQADEFSIKPAEPPEAAESANAGADDNAGASFRAKSVWTSDKGGTLTVIERKGEKFRALLASADGRQEKVVSGTVKGNAISWLARDARVIKGNAAFFDHFGTIRTGEDGDKIDFALRNDAQKKSDTATYRRKGK